MRVKGITGWPPLWITKIQGFRDAKRGMILCNDGVWDASYIRKKMSIGRVAINKCFQKLEKKTAKFFGESAVLCIEYNIIGDQLLSSEEMETGRTQGSRARRAAEVPAKKEKCRSRKSAIVLRLTELNESIITARNQTVGKKWEIMALTERRVQAYLHGASLALQQIPTCPVWEETCDYESEFNMCHRATIEACQKILTERGRDDANA